MDLPHRLQLAGRSLLAILDRKALLLPTGGWQVSHDLGRWWDAVLRLEESIGFAIPEELEQASLRNLRTLTDNSARMLINNPVISQLEGKCQVTLHNFRESFIAFGGLIKWRNNSWAHESAMQLVRAMNDALQPNGSLDVAKIESWSGLPLTADPSHAAGSSEGWFDSTATTGRSLEALIWLFESTHEPEVLQLAERIARHHLEHTTNRDGSMRSEIIDPENVGHDHSYLGTLRGLLLFGLLNKEEDTVKIVEATYRNAVRNRIVMESGWAPHDLGKLRFPNDEGDPLNEPASSGDSAQIALWLALHTGAEDLFDDVERIVRARLLPSQITEEDIHKYPERVFTKREIGAWGVYVACHATKSCIPDIVASVAHTLCDVYNHICTKSESGISINLHFDKEDDDVAISSIREHRAKLSVLVKHPCNIKIRIPSWAPQSTVEISVDGKKIPLKLQNTYARIAGDILKEGSEIVLLHDLPEKMTEEHMPSGKLYHFRWRGDEITGIDPQDGPLPFYPSMPKRS